jgi:hypothetical protein
MATFLARGRPCTLLHPKSNGQEKINRGITLSSHEAIETSISKRDRNAETRHHHSSTLVSSFRMNLSTSHPARSATHPTLVHSSKTSNPVHLIIPIDRRVRRHSPITTVMEIRDIRVVVALILNLLTSVSTDAMATGHHAAGWSRSSRHVVGSVLALSSIGVGLAGSWQGRGAGASVVGGDHRFLGLDVDAALVVLVELGGLEDVLGLDQLLAGAGAAGDGRAVFLDGAGGLRGAGGLGGRGGRCFDGNGEVAGPIGAFFDEGPELHEAFGDGSGGGLLAVGGWEAGVSWV